MSKIYLEWGESPCGDVVHISKVRSGRTELSCPFCECALIAAKGTKVQHHYRHDGETCRESLKGIPGIPGWDHFHFQASAKIVQLIKDGYERLGSGADGCQLHRGTYKARERLIKAGFVRDIIYGKLSYYDYYTPEAMIVLGHLPLQDFEPWMRETLAARREEFKARAKAGDIHPALLKVENKRQQSIMSASLYRFRYQLPDGRTLHKVGRTQRDPETRLKETLTDIKAATGQVAKGEILNCIQNLGHVEQYILYRYCDCQFEMGTHQEYFELNTQRTAGMSIDFDRLQTWPKPLSRAEKMVVFGKWESEEKRLEATRRGVAASDRMGRPKGTTIPEDKFLAKHKDIVDCLRAGDSLHAATEKTRKGYSTVQRVRATLKKSD